MENSPQSTPFFENDHVLIVHKCAGVLSVRSRFHSSEPEANVIDQFDKILPVHRLDREVEGLLLTAKSTHAQRICSAWFERKEIKKTYWALSCEVDLRPHGKLPFELERIPYSAGDNFVWKSRILRGKKRSYSSPHGDPAETHARLVRILTLESNLKVFQWELNPLTGRSHQLRFEMARHSHPILGDHLYFAPLSPTYGNGIALLAHSLDFRNCSRREEMGLPETLSLALTEEEFVGRVTSTKPLEIA